MAEPTMDDLRKAGAVASLAPLAASMTMLRSQIQEQAQIEGLAMQLAAVLGGRVKIALEEVERREALFADVSATLPRASERPRIAALESVLHDAMLGRLG